MRFGAYEAWVTVEDQRAEDFDVKEDPENNTVTAWIASKVGKRFAAHCRFPAAHERKSDIAVYLTVDGKAREGRLMAKTSPMTVTVMDKVSVSPTTDRFFLFSSVNTTDEDAYLERIADANNLGEITLELWPGFRGAIAPRQTREAEVDLKVHERSKKCGVHQAKLGGETPADSPYNCSFTRVGSRPAAIFTFRYRPLDMLIANDIAPSDHRDNIDESPADDTRAGPPPAPPSPGPAPHLDEPTAVKKEAQGEEETEEIRALEERLNSLRAKRKGSTSAARTAKKPKKEPLANRDLLQQGDVIDLTVGNTGDVVKREEPISHRGVFTQGEVIDLT